MLTLSISDSLFLTFERSLKATIFKARHDLQGQGSLDLLSGYCVSERIKQLEELFVPCLIEDVLEGL